MNKASHCLFGLMCLLMQLYVLPSQAQKAIQIIASNPTERLLVASLAKKEQASGDSLMLQSESQCGQLLLPFYAQGYLTANIDSVISDSLNSKVYISLGKPYRFAKIKPGNVDEELLSEIGFRDKLFFDKELRFERIVSLEESILSVCENNGYPFAWIRLDSAKIDGESLSGSLNLRKGNAIRIDSVVIRGDAEITSAYITNYLGIKPGDAYRESMIRAIPQRLKEIPFITPHQATELAFSEYSVKVILHLNKKKSSQVNGILGFLPDDKTPSKLRLSGETQLNLRNPFGAGESIDLAWKSPKALTQDLKIRLAYPFIVSRFGLDLGFALYKKDTAYLDIIQDAGVQYLLPQGNYIKVYINNRSSKTLSATDASLYPSGIPFANTKSTIYGLGFRSDRLDYRLNPRKGYTLKASAGAGQRSVNLSAADQASMLEKTPARATQYHANYEAELFVPLIGRSVFNLGLNGAKLISPSYYQNELYRIGGFKTLRGFNEESIYASSYDIVKVELRYLMEQNSYISAFWNGAYYENRASYLQGDPYDMPYGFGSGITFDTKLGIFSISYALGKQFNNPIQVKSGKVSFGLINNF